MNYFIEMVKRQAKEESEKANQYTLGMLYDFLDQFSEFDQSNLKVKFEDESAPGTYMSYRGVYDQISLDRCVEKTVGELKQQTKEAIGATFTGYNGGEYTMNNDTFIWVSEYGEHTGEGIVDTKITRDGIILIVKTI
jgi:hypothetical protein